MIYLDSAATTFQKPAAVQRAVVRAMRTMSSPGRGGYAAAQQADELLFRCRSAAAELFSVPSSEQVVFTMNATHGLNIAIKSLVHPCGRVVVSGYEHNAVTRPLHALGTEVIVAAAPLFSPQETVEAFERALAHEPDAVICTHVSNVFGAILPIERIAQLGRGASVPLIIDDRVDVAIACDAAGVHVGASDLPVAVCRRLLGPDKIVGATAKTVEAAVAAYNDGADYLGTGAIYPTTTHVTTKVTPVSVLNDVCRAVPIPVVAIGGLNADNMDVLADSPIKGIAVVSAVMKADDPCAAAAHIKEKFLKMINK